jgi:hypothetical protein
MKRFKDALCSNLEQQEYTNNQQLIKFYETKNALISFDLAVSPHLTTSKQVLIKF